MGFLQQPVQAKLSKLIGAEVRFDSLSVSLLGGSIEARGVTVAGDEPGRPVLTVRRVRAEISIPRALKKEIVIKSLTIEGPVVSIVKRADGRTNLPRPEKLEKKGEAEPVSPARAKTVDEAPQGSEESGGAWKLEAQRVLLIDGAAHYHADAPPGGEAMDLSAESILAEVKSAGGGLDFTCVVASLGSRGTRPLELGQLKFAGRADGVEDLSQVLKAKVNATVELGDLLRGEVDIPSLKPPQANIRVSGATSEFLPLLPRVVSSRLPSTLDGRVEINLRATYIENRLKISEIKVQATSIELTF